MQTITLTLTIQEAELVLASLGKQPLEIVMGLFQKIQKQASEQVKPQEPQV